MSHIDMLLPNKIYNPLVPSLLELLHTHISRMFVANGMIDRVISNQLEISQGPVVWNCCKEIINGWVINSKFTRIIRVDSDSIAHAEKNRSWSFSHIFVVTQYNVTERIFLKTYIFAMWQKLYSLQNIEPMPYSNWACLDSYVHVVSLMVFCLTCMINLFVIEMRIFCKDLVNDGIVELKRAEHIFLLDEVEADCFVPVQLAYLIEKSKILLLVEHFQSKKDKASTESRILLPHLIVNLIKGIHKHLLIMIFHNISFLIIFL